MRGDDEDSEQSVHNKTERDGPLNNVGRQSDSNVRRTLGHVEPTMGGVMTLVLVSYYLLLTISLSQVSFSYTQHLPEEQPQCRAKLWVCSKVCKWQRIRYELHMWRSHFNVQIFVVASVVAWAAYLL